MWVAPLADLAAQPQARLDHHGQRHPDNATLFLDADLIGLHLPQVTWVLDQMLMHPLALPAQAGPPIHDGAFVEPKTATIASTGYPWASNVTTRRTVSAAVRRQ